MAANMRTPSIVSQILFALISVIYLAESDIYNINTVRSRRQLSNSNYYQWITANTVLPRADWDSAIGTYNNTIYIFGGDSNRKQLIQFDITSHNFVDLGQNALPMDVWGDSQFYTQIIETTLFWIDTDSGNTIVRYDLETKSIHTNVTTNIPQNVGYDGCLASYNNCLYVLGGYNRSSITLSTVFSYNFIADTWTVLPSMQQKRHSFACIINPMTQVLYAIGGYNGSIYLGTIERISLFDIKNNKWIYMESMSSNWVRMRAVVWNQNVLLIGGGNIDYTLSEMLLINGTNDKVYSVGNLSYPISGVATILVKDRVYAFGGMNQNGNPVTTWQYLDL
eukprot:464315_1